MKRNILAGALYLLIAIIITFSWFHYGLMYGGVDIGIPTYNPQRILEIIVKPWWTETAPGYPRPINISAIPVQLFFTLLQQFGLPPFMIQAITFGILLFLMGFGVFLLAKDIMKGEKIGIALLAGFFYMVNPYMMVSVWHRVIFAAFFFAAALPFLFLFWKEWIKEKKITSLILFIAVNLIFSYMFATLAYIIVLWIFLGIYTLFEAVFPWSGWKKAVKILAFFSLGLVLWVLTNTWWILSVFFVFPDLASAQQSVGGTLSTLFVLSKYSTIPYVLPGLNPFYLFQGQELGEVFKHPLFLLIPWLGVAFITIGAYCTRKNREFIFWSILFITAVFLAKGFAPPLGYFYPYLFEKFLFLGVLRNPFEKFGILIPFAGSILFSIGFYNMASYFWKRNLLIGKAIILLSFGLFFGIYHWPFWSGTIFGILENRIFVEIPWYYKQANKWISDKKKDGNILHLPLASGDSSVYRWQYGYSGLDPNLDIFASNPSIFTRFGLPYLEDALDGFDLITRFDPSQQTENLKELFRAFNVRFIVLHNDMNWQNSNVQSIKKIKEILDKLPFLKKQNEIGQLSIYEVDERTFLSKIYLSRNFNQVISDQNYKYNSRSLFLKNDPAIPLLSYTSKNEEMQNLPGFNQTILTPSMAIDTSYGGLPFEEDSLQELPQPRLLPNSLLYPLVILKDAIRAMSYQRIGENIYLELAGKRLVEIYKIQTKYPNKSISSVVKRYKWYLDKAVDKILKEGLTDPKPPTNLKMTFVRHQVVLKQIYEKATDQKKIVVSQVIEDLQKGMINMNMQPMYQLRNEKNLTENDRQIYRFSVPTDGEYEILMANSKVANLYQNNLSQLDFQIDDNVGTKNSQIKDDLISFGTISLKKGLHEISFKQQNSVDLFRGGKENLEITSEKHKPATYTINVEPYYKDSTYLLSFDYWTKEGTEPIVAALQDSDPQEYWQTDDLSGQKFYQQEELLWADPYNKYWKSYKLNISPRTNSDNFSLQIASMPWDDCKIIPKWICDKEGIKYSRQRPSTISIRNIKLSRILDNPLFLRSKAVNQVSEKPADLTYTKKTSLVYEGNIVLDKPSYLIFSETFNNNWELTLSDGKNEYKPQKHYFANIYGNGWFLDKKGSYEFVIRFSAEKYLTIGIYISVFCLLSFMTVYLVGKYLKRNYEKSN